MAGNWNSGRRKQPTQLKLLRGNPGKRRLTPDQEPTPPALDATFDTPPPELAGNVHAETEWRRLAPLMRDCGLISQAERSTLTALCLEWSHYISANAMLRPDRRIRQQLTYITIADKALSHLERLWNQLGLTPSGRAKIVKTSAARNTPTPPPSKWKGLI